MNKCLPQEARSLQHEVDMGIVPDDTCASNDAEDAYQYSVLSPDEVVVELEENIREIANIVHVSSGAFLPTRTHSSYS